MHYTKGVNMNFFEAMAEVDKGNTVIFDNSGRSFKKGGGGILTQQPRRGCNWDTAWITSVEQESTNWQLVTETPRTMELFKVIDSYNVQFNEYKVCDAEGNIYWSDDRELRPCDNKDWLLPTKQPVFTVELGTDNKILAYIFPDGERVEVV
jgi:hypothetical protein